MFFVLKVFVSGLIIAAVSELGKRFTWFGAVLASLPLISILSFIWLYKETGDVRKVADLSYGILWAIVPSLIFFVVLPLLLKWGWKFTPALVASCVVMFVAYTLYTLVLARFGIKI